MTKKQYTEEFKEQIIKNAKKLEMQPQQLADIDVSPTTIYTWVRKTKKLGSTIPLPKNEAKRVQEIEKRLENISKENNTLKKLL